MNDEELIEQATYALIDYDTDVADRGVSDEHYRERRADVERVFPILRQEPRVVDDAMVKRGWDAVNGVVTQHQIRLILTAALTPDGQEKNR